jgi:ribonucleoside-triphosphate reductase
MPWDKSKISSALIREHHLSPDTAYEVAGIVESKIFSSDIKRISTGLIRELVDNELFDRGMTGLLKDSTMISFPTFNMEQYLKTGIDKWEASPLDFNSTISRDVLRQYSLQNVFSSRVSEFHNRGDLHIHFLGDINRVIRRRHCGPLKSESPHAVLRDVCFRLAELQPYFVCYPRLDYFNIFFAPLCRYLKEEDLRDCFREFCFLLKQMCTASNARDVFEIDLYSYIPSYISPIDPGEIFAPINNGQDRGTYADYYHDAHTFARLFLEECQNIPDICSLIHFNIHHTEFFAQDEIETEFLRKFYTYATSGPDVTFCFGGNGTTDSRMEFLRGGDTEFHRVSINCSRLFYDMAVRGYEEITERFKTVCATALKSGIEKLDFLSSLMRKPGQILWGLGRRSGDESVFDVLNSCMTIQITGIHEALRFSRQEDFCGEEVLREFVWIAQDIIDSKGEEYPFAVQVQPGRIDSASLRFAELDKEQYPEKRNFLQVDRKGRLHYEGVPAFYGDNPVPIVKAAEERSRFCEIFEGPAEMKLFKGYQTGSLSKFLALLEGIMEQSDFRSFIFENEP